MCSTRGALPETCGPDALLVDPDEEAAFTEAVMSAATDEQVRARLVRAGPRRAAGFTWTRTAELTDQAIAGALP